MHRSDLPAQPGSPGQAHRLLPLGRLGGFLLSSALACVLATLSFVWLAAGIFANRFVTIDDRLILGLSRRWSPTLNQVMLGFTTAGDPWVVAGLVVLGALALLWSRRWIDAGALLVAGAGAGLLNQALKLSYQRLRPDLVQGPFDLNTYSFPSGHAMGTVVGYGMLAYLAMRLIRRPLARALVGLAAAALAALVGLSRVYFAVHFPTDVLGGYIAGLAWLLVSINLLQVAEWYVRRRTVNG